MEQTKLVSLVNVNMTIHLDKTYFMLCVYRWLWLYISLSKKWDFHIEYLHQIV